MERFINKLYLGFLNAHILYHASKEPIYGKWMMEELNHHGYKIGPSHIYPLLRSLLDEGLLLMESKIVDKHTIKYYQTTEKGNQVLKDLMVKIKELSFELL